MSGGSRHVRGFGALTIGLVASIALLASSGAPSDPDDTGPDIIEEPRDEEERAGAGTSSPVNVVCEPWEEALATADGEQRAALIREFLGLVAGSTPMDERAGIGLDDTTIERLDLEVPEESPYDEGGEPTLDELRVYATIGRAYLGDLGASEAIVLLEASRDSVPAFNVAYIDRATLDLRAAQLAVEEPDPAIAEEIQAQLGSDLELDFITTGDEALYSELAEYVLNGRDDPTSLENVLADAQPLTQNIGENALEEGG